MRHVLVTNDFPPKVGGIQSYLWELWRRLPADQVTVLTTAHPAAPAFDAAAGFRIERSHRSVLLPTPALARRIDALAAEVGAELVLLDPVVPLGVVARWLEHPYGLVVHGAEMTIPGRLPGYRHLATSVLRNASVVVAAGGYPLHEAERAARTRLPAVVVPPGVDIDRFVPLDPARRAAARRHFGLPADARIVLGVSRLVPRKGFDVLIRAAALLAPGRDDLLIVIGGTGRDRPRLERLAQHLGAPVRFLGPVADGDLPDLYGCADLFVMACRNRWLGLEQEGFGIVFLEAAACGVASVAGRSGGSHEAVADGGTGVVLAAPRSAPALAERIGALLADPDRCRRFGRAARDRAVDEFAYDDLAAHLGRSLDAHCGVAPTDPEL